MKRIYLLSLWLLACLVLPMKGQAVAQADLLNAERFEHIDSSADSGRGDGKYLDLSSVKPVSAPNGHRRIEAVIYVSMPADFGDEKYKLPNLMYKKAYGIAYDDEP